MTNKSEKTAVERLFEESNQNKIDVLVSDKRSLENRLLSANSDILSLQKKIELLKSTADTKEKPDFELFIFKQVGIKPGAGDMTPMDYGECKTCLNKLWNDYVSPLESEVARLTKIIADRDAFKV